MVFGFLMVVGQTLCVIAGAAKNLPLMTIGRIFFGVGA